MLLAAIGLVVDGYDRGLWHVNAAILALQHVFRLGCQLLRFGIGAEQNMLYITVDTSLYRIPLKARGFHVQYDADRLGRSVEEHEQTVTPIGGRLRPEDIAPMVVYLCGDSARMITGQAYNVDGGNWMS